MNENEAHPRAAVLLADAGWTPHPKWGVFTRGTLVMGGDHMGGFHVKDWGLDLHGPDTPDTAEEAAAWLVQRFAIPADVVTLDAAPEAEQTPAHEPDPGNAPGPEPSEHASDGDGGPDLSGEDAGASTGPSFEGDGRGTADVPEDADRADGSNHPIDAEFTLDTIELIPPDPDPDFGAELLEFEQDTEPKEEAPTGAFIFGDNLDQKRTAAIGLVVQISLAKQEAIWADAGAHPDEFGALTSAVVRDTIDGTYRGPQATYDRFVFLSQHDNIARRVQAVERERVTMLATATREQIEAFDPEAGWPQ